MAVDPWAKPTELFLLVMAGVGPYGTIVVSIIVGLGLVVVLVAHFSGLYSSRRADRQSLAFADRLIADVDKLSQRELTLRADLERQEREADMHRLRAVELQADTELMRMQLRRYIETLRAIRDGRLLPSAITDADLAEVVK